MSVTIYTGGAAVQVFKTDPPPPPPDVQQLTAIPNQDWEQGTAATLSILSHFTSPSGKQLEVTADTTLPAGVTMFANVLVYDGSVAVSSIDLTIDVHPTVPPSVIPLPPDNEPLAQVRQFPEGRDGATPTRFRSAAGADIYWRNVLGDWLDKAGIAQGLTPWAQAQVRGSDSTTVFNVTALVKLWATRNVGMLIHAPNISDAVYSTKEHATLPGPKLALTFADATTATIDASADTSINAGNESSNGRMPTMTLGSGGNLLLRFATPTKAVTNATLTLNKIAQFGSDAPAMVFEISPPIDALPPVQTGIGTAYPGDAGIENHPAVLIGDTHMAGLLTPTPIIDPPQVYTLPDNGDWRVRFGPDPTGQRPGTCMRVRFSPTDNGALGSKYPFIRTKAKTVSNPTGELEEAYMRYSILFDADWDNINQGGKFPGFISDPRYILHGGETNDGTAGWVVDTGYAQEPEADDPTFGLTAGRTYMYDCDTPKIGQTFGRSMPWQAQGLGFFPKLKWHDIELYTKMNTNDGAAYDFAGELAEIAASIRFGPVWEANRGNADGIIRIWVDGRMVLERLGNRLRGRRPILGVKGNPYPRDGYLPQQMQTGDRFIPELKVGDPCKLGIAAVWLQFFYGGSGPGSYPPHYMSVWMRNLVVATSYIGPVA